MSKHEPASLDAVRDGRSGDNRGVDGRAPKPIDPAHRAAIEAGLEDMRAGRIAFAAEIDATYARFGRNAQ